MRISNNNYSHQPIKRLGQNFLIEPLVIQQIIKAIKPDQNQIIIEIGPGLGALTRYIINNCEKLIAIEIDSNLCSILIQKFNQEIIDHKLQIINQNVLKVDFISLIKQIMGCSENLNIILRLIGNLPYNITTPLLFKLFTYGSLIKDYQFLLQKEVAERLTALPNNKQYGRLSVMAQYHAKMKKIFYVGSKAFNPTPKVESCFIEFIPYIEPPFKANNYQQFYNLVITAFSQRRKKLSNCLKQYCTEKNLTNLGIDPGCRPEQLSVDEFVKISNFIAN
jgi:16S rRNA (adenine1518-N6/adenine1519-N6)-dimethyltransferase